jgi:hypothetical protein
MTMPQNKDLKRLVRARMRKTGEAYTTARSHIIKKPKTKTSTTTRASNAGIAASDYAAIAGMSDEKIKAKTGCTWERWVHALDRHGADKMAHREIAALVKTKYKTPDWWTQTVTVGYERIKGLRARGQRRDGSYEATKSRTFNVPVSQLFDAWSNASTRRRWLDQPVKIRTAAEPKSMRVGLSDGSIVAVGFYPKTKSKSSLAVQHAKLPDKATADRLKKYWAERLDELAKVFWEGKA